VEKRVIKIEADSLEQAREQLKSQIPRGLRLLSEKVVSSGRRKTCQGVGDTVEAAFGEARSKLPPSAKILEEKVCIPPSEETVMVEAFDEQRAERQALANAVWQASAKMPTIEQSVRVKGLVLKSLGKGGFLGIGKKPNRYEAQITQQAVVEIAYKEKVKIRAIIEGEAEIPKIERESIPAIVRGMIKRIEKTRERWIEECMGILVTLKRIGPDVLPVLVQALKKERGNSWPPGTALCWACGTYKEEALPMLIELLSDNVGAVRFMAEEILCCLGSRETEEAVRAFKALDRTDEVKRGRTSAAIAQTIRDNSVERLPPGEIIAKLLWLGSRTDWLGPGALGFALARDIGQRLYDFGGITAMQEAYRRLGEFEWREELKGRRIPGGVATLNGAWKDIGGWMP